MCINVIGNIQIVRKPSNYEPTQEIKHIDFPEVPPNYNALILTRTFFWLVIISLLFLTSIGCIPIKYSLILFTFELHIIELYHKYNLYVLGFIHSIVGL